MLGDELRRCREHHLQFELRMRLDRLHGGFDARIIRARADDDADVGNERHVAVAQEQVGRDAAEVAERHGGERLGRSLLHARPWFVILCDVRAENGIEAHPIAPSDIGHERYVPVGTRRKEELLAQSRKRGRYIWPTVKAMP